MQRSWLRLLLSISTADADVARHQSHAVKAAPSAARSGVTLYDARAEFWRRVVGTGSYTPSQAAQLDTSGNAPTPVMSNVFYVWNGTSYASYSGSGVTAGRLPYFSSFWVKVLSGAFGHTVELLIPKLPTQTVSPF